MSHITKEDLEQANIVDCYDYIQINDKKAKYRAEEQRLNYSCPICGQESYKPINVCKDCSEEFPIKKNKNKDNWETT